GRSSGQSRQVAVGFLEEPDGSIVVASGSAEAGWARNLLADPRCRFSIDGPLEDAIAEELGGAAHAAAVRDLILRYGTPAERLGRGPAFRIRRTGR
ncbi:MAG TPA: nitroreductase/quinone reductase family protein, partial [Candidatus Limnocylindrales bacterium]|nr:nitroreductase/quinone reductase family protein [Candidatus Limnocylindrales bacterium]